MLIDIPPIHLQPCPTIVSGLSVLSKFCKPKSNPSRDNPEIELAGPTLLQQLGPPDPPGLQPEMPPLPEGAGTAPTTEAMEVRVRMTLSCMFGRFMSFYNIEIELCAEEERGTLEGRMFGN